MSVLQPIADPPSPPAPPTPSWLKQVYTLLRYVGTGAGTLGTAAALFSVLDKSTADNIVAAFQKVDQDLVQLFGDASRLGYLVIPVVTGWLVKIGITKSSTAAQVKDVQALPTAQVVTTDKNLADAVPGVIHARTLPVAS